MIKNYSINKLAVEYFTFKDDIASGNDVFTTFLFCLKKQFVVVYHLQIVTSKFDRKKLLN